MNGKTVIKQTGNRGKEVVYTVYYDFPAFIINEMSYIIWMNYWATFCMLQMWSLLDIQLIYVPERVCTFPWKYMDYPNDHQCVCFFFCSTVSPAHKVSWGSTVWEAISIHTTLRLIPLILGQSFAGINTGQTDFFISKA